MNNITNNYFWVHYKTKLPELELSTPFSSFNTIIIGFVLGATGKAVSPWLASPQSVHKVRKRIGKVFRCGSLGVIFDYISAMEGGGA